MLQISTVNLQIATNTLFIILITQSTLKKNSFDSQGLRIKRLFFEETSRINHLKDLRFWFYTGAIKESMIVEELEELKIRLGINCYVLIIV